MLLGIASIKLIKELVVIESLRRKCCLALKDAELRSPRNWKDKRWESSETRFKFDSSSEIEKPNQRAKTKKTLTFNKLIQLNN